MPDWTPEMIWAALESYNWVPPGAAHATTSEYELVVTPGSYALSRVANFRVSDPAQAESVLMDLRKRVLALGGNGVRFDVTGRSQPADLKDRLLRHGYQSLVTADVLCWSLKDAAGKNHLPEARPVPGITVKDVATDDDYRAFRSLETPIFGDQGATPELEEAFLDAFRKERAEGKLPDRVVAWDGNRPVGSGGSVVVDRVARLWGGGVLESYRKRGIYQAMVRRRCERSLERGGEIATVTARTGTSGPILKHHGWNAIGELETFEARW
jgi:hypothetical protein